MIKKAAPKKLGFNPPVQISGFPFVFLPVSSYTLFSRGAVWTVISAMKNMSARLSRFYARIKEVLILFFGFFVLIIVSPITSFAQTTCPADKAITDLGCLPKDPIQFIGSFYTIGLGIIGGVSLLFIIIGGYTLLTSQGNPNQVNVGKSYIFYAIAGLILAIFGYFFIEVFLIDILHIPGFGH